MALVTKNMSINVGGGGMAGPKIHMYTTSDALATAAASGYFNTFCDSIATGDAISIHSTATTGGGSKWYRAVNTANVITVVAYS